MAKTVSEIQSEKNLWFVRITNESGASYRVVSVDRASIEDYRNEILKKRAQRSK